MTVQSAQFQELSWPCYHLPQSKTNLTQFYHSHSAIEGIRSTIITIHFFCDTNVMTCGESKKQNKSEKQRAHQDWMFDRIPKCAPKPDPPAVLQSRPVRSMVNELQSTKRLCNNPHLILYTIPLYNLFKQWADPLRKGSFRLFCVAQTTLKENTPIDAIGCQIKDFLLVIPTFPQLPDSIESAFIMFNRLWYFWDYCTVRGP